MAVPPGPTDPSPGAGREHARAPGALRSYALAEGVLLLLLGFLALVFPYIASRWVVAMVGLAFLVGGLAGWINTLARSPQLRGVVSFWRLVVATLFLVAGIWMVRQMAAGPLEAAAQVAAVALAIGVVFLVEGLVEIGVALCHRSIPGWRWGLTNGVVTLILGILILSMQALSLLWVLGTLVGISFLLSGIDLLTFSSSFHDQGD